MGTPNKNFSVSIISVIIQSTSSNLEYLIGSLTMLDNILSNNVNIVNPISKNSQGVSLLKDLFSSCISGKKFAGNNYIWNTFQAFIMNKKKVDIHVSDLDRYCHNKGLLGLTLRNIVKMEEEEKEEKEYLLDKYKNKNLLKPQIISIFNNVTYLEIWCSDYPLSMESLLSLINGTQIKKVEIFDTWNTWLPLLKVHLSFNNISRKYKQSNFNLQFKEWNQKLIITYNE